MRSRGLARGVHADSRASERRRVRRSSGDRRRFGLDRDRARRCSARRFIDRRELRCRRRHARHGHARRCHERHGHERRARRALGRRERSGRLRDSADAISSGPRCVVPRLSGLVRRALRRHQLHQRALRCLRGPLRTRTALSGRSLHVRLRSGAQLLHRRVLARHGVRRSARRRNPLRALRARVRDGATLRGRCLHVSLSGPKACVRSRHSLSALDHHGGRHGGGGGSARGCFAQASGFAMNAMAHAPLSLGTRCSPRSTRWPRR